MQGRVTETWPCFFMRIAKLCELQSYQDAINFVGDKDVVQRSKHISSSECSDRGIALAGMLGPGAGELHGEL